LKDILEQGIEFPTINPPNEVNYEFDDSYLCCSTAPLLFLHWIDENGKELVV
jgi:hypothetical protein